MTCEVFKKENRLSPEYIQDTCMNIIEEDRWL